VRPTNLAWLPYQFWSKHRSDLVSLCPELNHMLISKTNQYLDRPVVTFMTGTPPVCPASNCLDIEKICQKSCQFPVMISTRVVGLNQKDSIGMKNLFVVKHPVWKYLRAKIAPTSTRNKLRQMVEYLQEQPAVGDNIKLMDAQELSYKYMTDLIASVISSPKWIPSTIRKRNSHPEVFILGIKSLNEGIIGRQTVASLIVLRPRDFYHIPSRDYLTERKLKESSGWRELDPEIKKRKFKIKIPFFYYIYIQGVLF